MEAPEKLYLHPNHKGEVGASWLTFPLTNEDVEYVREDVFIENAFDFFKNELCCYISAQNFTIDEERLKRDFIKYMED